MPNLKNKTKFNSSSIPKNVGWLEKYGDGGLKSVTGPAPKLDAKTIAEGKRIASGYNNANKQNAQISQTRNWSQADQEHSDRVKSRINNPASDVGILAANMASNLTRFRNLTPEEIARVTDNPGETVNLASGIATDALTNELVGYGATKAIPFVSKSAKAAGKYLTEKTALKNAYKLNPYAFKPNPESYYRMVGKEGIKDATESGIIRANQKIPLADNGEPFGGLITPEFEDAYFSKSRPFDGREYGKTPWYGKYEGPGMIEVKNKDYFKPLSKHIDYIGLPKSTIKTSDEAIKFYKEHWLQGYKEVPKELPGSSNKINTKKMWRIENPNIKFNPSKVANENAQQEHVGNWFSDDINYVSDYLRKNQKVPGSRLAEVNVPESELSKYHISNYPDMKDVEPRNWLIPDAFNRNYTDLSHLPISGGNLSKIKENQNYIKELVNKKIAEKKYGGWLDTYEDGGETDPPVNLRSASTQLASPVSTQAPEVPLNKTGWDWVKQKYENRQPSEWNMLMMDKSGSYVDSGVDPFSLMLTSPQQVIKAGVKGGKALLDASKSNKIKQVEAPKELLGSSNASSLLERINLERQGVKTKSNVIKENIQDGNFKITSRSTPNKGLVNVNIESPTGSIQATRNPDGSYGLSFEDANPFNAGKSMLKLKDQLAGKTIHETKSFSTDSYANILKLKKKLPFEEAGFLPLNSSNKINNFLDDLVIKNNNEWSASSKFKSEESAIEGAKRIDDYMLKLGETTKSKVVNNNGKFEVHVPNYKIKVPEVNNTFKELLSSPNKSGFDFNFITKPLTPFTKNELTKINGKNMAYRKIGNKSGLQDLINKGGSQAPAPFRMKSGQTADTPFFGMGKTPTESYRGIYAVEADPFNPKYNWSHNVAGTSNYGVAPFDSKTGRLIKNIPIEDLNVYRKKWFSNNYKKLDPNNLEEGLKYADAQYIAENSWKWGVRGLAADQFFNNGEIRKNIIEKTKKQISTSQNKQDNSQWLNKYK